MTYSDKLKDPRWQRKRLEIMQRDDFTCRNCGAKDKTLNIHHIRYLKGLEPWEYKEFYLVTLCEECHTKEERAVIRGDYNEPVAVERKEPTMHRLIAFLCAASVANKKALQTIKDRANEIKEAEMFVKGAKKLFCSVGGNENQELFTKDENKLIVSYLEMGMPTNIESAVNESIDRLGFLVLQGRDLEIKAKLKQPGLSQMDIARLLQEARSISNQINVIGRQRTTFDDELPSATFKPRNKPSYRR